MLKHIISILLLVTGTRLSAQEEPSLPPSAVLVHFSYALEFPGGDMADRFGNGFKISGGVDYITAHNVIFGIEGGIRFGNKVKQDVIASLRRSDGTIIGSNLLIADVALRQRGLYIGVLAGKLFPLSPKNKRSGIRATLGMGILQHKIRIQDNAQSVPQLSGDYKKGYDRLTNGLTISEFVGYQYLSPNRLINFMIGVEFQQAFTKNRRELNFDTMMKDDNKYVDFLLGIRLGWTLPFYVGENPDEIFY